MSTPAHTNQDTVRPDPNNLAFSHPKNYLGVPVAIQDDRATGPLVTGYIVGTAGQAKQGAKELNFLTDTNELTFNGAFIAKRFKSHFGSTTDALEAIDSWRRSTTRFSVLEPTLARDLRPTFTKYKPANALLSAVATHTDNECTLPELANTDGTSEYLLRTPDSPGDLSSTDAYRSHTTFQLKSCLYHLGLLTQPGRSTDSLVPEQDVWRLTDDALEVLS